MIIRSDIEDASKEFALRNKEEYGDLYSVQDIIELAFKSGVKWASDYCGIMIVD